MSRKGFTRFYDDLVLCTESGELKSVPESAGTRGYDDLRWHTTGEHIGKGLRRRVASVDHLARMLASPLLSYVVRREAMPERNACRRAATG